MANMTNFDMTIEGKRIKEFTQHLSDASTNSHFSNVIVPRIWIYTANQQWVSTDKTGFIANFIGDDDQHAVLSGEGKWSFVSATIFSGPTTIPLEATKNRKERNVLASIILREAFANTKLRDEEMEVLDMLVDSLASKIGKKENRLTFDDVESTSTNDFVIDKLEKIFEKERNITNKDIEKKRGYYGFERYYPSAVRLYVQGNDLKTLEEMKKEYLANWERHKLYFVSITSLAICYDLGIKVLAYEPNLNIRESILIDRDGWTDEELEKEE